MIPPKHRVDLMRACEAQPLLSRSSAMFWYFIVRGIDLEMVGVLLSFRNKAVSLPIVLQQIDRQIHKYTLEPIEMFLLPTAPLFMQQTSFSPADPLRNFSILSSFQARMTYSH